MKSKVPVSVVIPCFNCEKTITRSIKSIVNQSVLPTEVILIDDCSTDNTINLINAFSGGFGFEFKILKHATNMGAAAARNTGLDNSNCIYIAFLDADDTWAKNKLELQFEFMVNNPSVALCGHGLEVWSSRSNDSNIELISVKQITLRLLMFHNYFNTPTVMLRKTNARFPAAQRYAEDAAFWLNLASNNEHLVYLSATLAYVHKPLFGVAGLSSSLFNMELFEIKNFLRLFSLQKISFFLFLAATCYSLIKYIRRLILTFVVNVRRFSFPFFRKNVSKDAE